MGSGSANETEPAEDGLLPDREADPMAELEREGGLFVREAEVLRLRPDRGDLGCRRARSDQVDRLVEDRAAALVGVDLGRGRATDRKRAVVAGSVALERVQDVEVGWVARSQDPVGVHVRVGAAALARDRVDALNVLRAEVVEHLGDEADALVLPHAGLHGAVELVVGGVDHGARRRQQRDLVLCLDDAGALHQLLPVDDLDPFPLEREQNGQLDHVDAEWLLRQPTLLELDAASAPRLRPGPTSARTRRAVSRFLHASARPARGSRARGVEPQSRSPS